MAQRDASAKGKMKSLKKNDAHKRILWLCRAGIIAAMYVALTYLAMAFGLHNNAIQIRFSEALCVLAFITPAAIPGMTIGCFLANILTGCAPLDIFLGPVATLIGAVGAYLIGKIGKGRAARVLCTLPNILANTIIVPFIIYVCYTDPSEQSLVLIPFYALTVFVGEVISSGVLGSVLLFSSESTLRKISK